MEDTIVLQRSSRAIFAEIGDEIIFLHEGEGVYFSLDGVGTFFWRNLATPRSFGDLVQVVLGEFEVDEPECREDLVALVADMAQKGLIEVDPEP